MSKGIVSSKEFFNKFESFPLTTSKTSSINLVSNYFRDMLKFGPRKTQKHYFTSQGLSLNRGESSALCQL